MQHFRILPCGDCALSIEFPNVISEQVHEQVALTTRLIREEKLEGVEELIPTYRALMVCYDPLRVDYDTLVFRIENLSRKRGGRQSYSRRTIEIPVCYGGEYGPDLGTVASYNHLTEKHVIRIHSRPRYLVYMLGFTPGFPYLGGMSKRIATPRLTAPRVKIPGGSVGIAGEQTGLYPIDSPGGWQIIGRTPLELYCPDREKPILLEASQYLRFCPVSEREYHEIERRIAEGVYQY